MSDTTLHRLGGLLAIALGVALCWFFLWLPLQAARAGEPEISYQMKAFIVVPLSIVFGLAFLVLGDRFEYRTPDHKNMTAAGWTAFAVAAVLTGLGWWWFDSQFTALGYV